MKFTDTEYGTISNALRVAAERFSENVKTLEHGSDADDRLAKQFKGQAKAAMAIYDRIGKETGHIS